MRRRRGTRPLCPVCKKIWREKADAYYLAWKKRKGDRYREPWSSPYTALDLEYIERESRRQCARGWACRYGSMGETLGRLHKMTKLVTKLIKEGELK